MYPHHRESLEIMKKHFEEQGNVIALIFGGSVAKGCERPDSDLDCMVVLSEEDYAKREREHTTAETIGGLCTYEGGYFDVKYMAKSFLQDAADHGSKPARNAFDKAQVLFTRDSEIPEIVSHIAVFQREEKADKLLSFFADLWLNYYYFLKSCPLDGYMRLHAVNEVIYSVYRITLQEQEILFPSNRRLQEFVAAVSSEAKRLTDLGDRLAQTQQVEDADAFVNYFYQITSCEIPKDMPPSSPATPQILSSGGEPPALSSRTRGIWEG